MGSARHPPPITSAPRGWHATRLAALRCFHRLHRGERGPDTPRGAKKKNLATKNETDVGPEKQHLFEATARGGEPSNEAGYPSYNPGVAPPDPTCPRAAERSPPRPKKKPFL